MQTCRARYGFRGPCVVGTSFHKKASQVFAELTSRGQVGSGKARSLCVCCRKYACNCITRRRRTGTVHSWVYYDAHGLSIKDMRVINRLDHIRMPPAYTDVRLNADEQARLQGTGRDKNGKWQYRYSRAHSAHVRNKKFVRMRRFIAQLPSIRSKYKKLMHSDVKVSTQRAALALALIDNCSLRPGSPDYVRQNKTYGGSTLRQRHLRQSGPTKHVVVFSGKRGKETTCVVHKNTHPVAYAALGRLLRPVRSLSTPEAVNQLLPTGFTAKDFRTYGANVAFVRAACRDPDAPVSTYVEASAQKLNNTPAVCKKNYVDPALYAWGAVKPLSFPTTTPGRPATCTQAEALLRRILNDI